MYNYFGDHKLLLPAIIEAFFIYLNLLSRLGVLKIAANQMLLQISLLFVKVLLSTYFTTSDYLWSNTYFIDKEEIWEM